MRTVYNLKVAGTPEYFANGILVHNCDALMMAYDMPARSSTTATVSFGEGDPEARSDADLDSIVAEQVRERQNPYK